MMKKATVKTGRNRKERRAGLWAISLIVSFQVLGWVLFSMATPGPVGAKTFTVTSTLDETDTAPGDGVCISASGYCTLRAAIQEANAFVGPDVIKLKTGNYMLTIAGILEDACATGDLDITDDLTITGTGAKNTFINGGRLDRVFHIDSIISVTIADVTIQNGLATDGSFVQGGGAGGGILSASATLTLKGITISNNAASGGDGNYGGGIYNWGGTVTITKSTLSNSTISNNFASASAGGIGGAIYNDGGTGTVIQSNISNNVTSSLNIAQGGGIYTQQSSLTITGSKISNNVTRGNNLGMGGAIRCYLDEVTISGSTISGNAVSGTLGPGLGGGIFVGDSTLTVRNSSKIIRNLASDSGGGIAFVGTGTGNISKDSTIAKNIPDNIYP